MEVVCLGLLSCLSITGFSVLPSPHCKSWERVLNPEVETKKMSAPKMMFVFILGEISVLEKYRKGKDVILLARIGHCYQFGAYLLDLLSINIFPVLFT